MPLITKKQILEEQYNNLYPALETSRLALEALRILPPEMELEPKYERSSFGIVKTAKTVSQRMEELCRDIQLLEARIKIIQRELENEH